MAQARADKRMKRIVAQPDEQYLYAFSPNKARGEVDRPGMPCRSTASSTTAAARRTDVAKKSKRPPKRGGYAV
jgi:hypothetical protein